MSLGLGLDFGFATWADKWVLTVCHIDKDEDVVAEVEGGVGYHVNREALRESKEQRDGRWL